MRIDAEFWSLLSGCVRMLLFSLTGQIMIIMVCDQLLVRRRSAAKLMICLILKILITSILVSTVLQHYYAGELWMKFLGIASNMCMFLLCYIMLVHTYYGGWLKCLIAENISEIMISVFMCPGLILAGYLEGRENVFVVYGKLTAVDLVYYVVMLLMTVGLCRLAGPLLHKFRTCHIRHKKAVIAFSVVCIISMQLMSIGDVQDGYLIMLLFYMIFLVYALAVLGMFVLMYLYQRQKIRTENTFLNMQLHLMESHYESMQNQIRRMEKCQQLMDEQMKEIRDNPNLSEGKTAAYLNQLKQDYDSIRAGVYCNDWKVDAVLYCEAEAARSQGISVGYSLAEYDRGEITEEQLVRILFSLFDYGIKAIQEVNPGKEKKIFLRMGGVLNQFLIEFCTTEERTDGAAYRKLRKSIRKMHGSLLCEKQSDGLRYTVTMERTAG